jgi:MoxR-like ATPase
MRPVVAAARLIPDGMPADALLSAMAKSWDNDARENAEIPAFDTANFTPKFSDSDREIWERRIRETPKSGGEHPMMAYVEMLAKNRQPIFLVGPAGTGKSYIAKQIAEKLGLPYGETPMTPGATRGDLLGRWVGNNNYIPSEFVRIYSGGGIFNFEEIDAADAGMLLVLNNALANTELYNSVTGETITRHADFIAVATGNTHGTGATREFSSRERLDAATIDRWRMGKVEIPHDDLLEEDLIFGRI